MATAVAVRQSRWVLHERGTWSAKEDRVPSAVWLGILWVGMIAGFGTDIPDVARENPPVSNLIWVHAAVFAVWMLLLTAQVLLVLGNRVAWHRKLGWLAAGWACLMAVMGPVGVIASVMRGVRVHGPRPYPFFSVHAVDIGGFLVLLAWGISLRKNPAAHKRMMILSTVAMADPGFSRFTGYFIDHVMPSLPKQMDVFSNRIFFGNELLASAFTFFVFFFYGNVLLIALMAAWDWWRGRLMRQFVVGSAGLVAALYVASLLVYSESWKALTLVWVKALAKHLG